MKTTKPKITMSEMMKRPGMAKANPEIASELARNGLSEKKLSNDIQASNLKPYQKEALQNVLSKKQSQHDKLIARFLGVWGIVGGLTLKAEHQFHPFRRFKFDFAHVPTMTAIEIEGGIFMKHGGHSSITGILRDIEKYNLAALGGWHIFRLASNMMKIQDIKPISDHITKTHKMIESFGI